MQSKIILYEKPIKEQSNFLTVTVPDSESSRPNERLLINWKRKKKQTNSHTFSNIVIKFMVFPNFHRKPLHSQFKSIGKRKTRLISIKIDFSKRQNRQQNPYNTMYFPKKKSYNIYPAFTNYLFTLLEHENVLLVILTLKQVTVQSISIFFWQKRRKKSTIF